MCGLWMLGQYLNRLINQLLASLFVYTYVQGKYLLKRGTTDLCEHFSDVIDWRNRKDIFIIKAFTAMI